MNRYKMLKILEIICGAIVAILGVLAASCLTLYII